MLSPFPSQDIAPPPPKNASSSLQDSLPGAHLASCHLSCAFMRAESRAGKRGRRQPLELRCWGWGSSVVSSLWPEMGSEAQDRLQSSSPINIHSLSHSSEL